MLLFRFVSLSAGMSEEAVVATGTQIVTLPVLVVAPAGNTHIQFKAAPLEKYLCLLLS